MLSREQIIRAFQLLAERLSKRDVVGEINLLGGTAMMLGFKTRQSTKDVDAIFQPASIIREEARAVAAELEIQADWINDAAKGFVSPKAEFQPLQDLEFPNLRIQVPTAEYLLAMKVLSSRVGLGSPASADKEDIRFLIRWLRLSTTEAVFEIVERYYDRGRLLPRSLYLVEEILAEEENAR